MPFLLLMAYSLVCEYPHTLLTFSLAKSAPVFDTCQVQIDTGVDLSKAMAHHPGSLAEVHTQVLCVHLTPALLACTSLSSARPLSYGCTVLTLSQGVVVEAPYVPLKVLLGPSSLCN